MFSPKCKHTQLFYFSASIPCGDDKQHIDAFYMRTLLIMSRKASLLLLPFHISMRWGVFSQRNRGTDQV